jgi:hypothetical protein
MAIHPPAPTAPWEPTPDRQDEHFECLRFWPSYCAPVAAKPARALDQAAMGGQSALGQTSSLGADRHHLSGRLRWRDQFANLPLWSRTFLLSQKQAFRVLDPAHGHDPAY